MQPSRRIPDLVFPCFSLKREMRVVGEDFGLQPVTIAMAFVYFEKLVLQSRLNKQNRYVGMLTDGTQPSHVEPHWTLPRELQLL